MRWKKVASALQGSKNTIAIAKRKYFVNGYMLANVIQLTIYAY